MSRPNVFTQVLTEHLESLVQLRLIGVISDEQATKSAKALRESLAAFTSDEKFKKHGHMQSTSVAINGEDPFADPQNVRCYARLNRMDEGRFQLIEEVSRRIQAQCLCTAFENTERYVKDVGGRLFWQVRKTLKLKDRKNFEKAKGDKVKATGTAPYYREYAAWLGRRDCADLLNVMADYAPELSRLSEGNSRDIDYLAMLKAVAFCRHAIVHSDGRVDPEALRKCDMHTRRLIGRLTTRSALTGHDAILPEHSAFTNHFAYLSEFAYIVYRASSEASGMPIDFVFET